MGRIALTILAALVSVPVILFAAGSMPLDDQPDPADPEHWGSE